MAFICAVGSGGTLAGTADFLREKRPDIKIGIADPMGSALFEHYANGTLKAEGGSVSEGIGQGRITGNLEGLEIDMPFQVTDEEALPILYDLLDMEGLLLADRARLMWRAHLKWQWKWALAIPSVPFYVIAASVISRKSGILISCAQKFTPLPHWLEN